MPVAVIFTCWMVVWTGLGTLVGTGMGAPLGGAIYGFIFAVLATFSWPWIMPKFIDDWMDDNYYPAS